ncbi:MAG: primosomal protein N' [Deltaproteobacteria bacterium]|nr:primosomal protein N' [Deltaproteobacteria bacterium]
MDDRALQPKEILAEVAVFSAVDKTLHYSVPESIRPKAAVGCRVLVPLGRREVMGLILSLGVPEHPPSQGIVVRPLRAVLDREALLPQGLLGLCRWVSTYYAYPLGEVLQNALPPAMEKSLSTRLELTREGLEHFAADSATPFVKLLLEKPHLSLQEIRRKRRNLGNWEEELRYLEAEGWVARTFDWKTNAATEETRKTASPCRIVPGEEAAVPPLELLPDQQAIYETLLPHIHRPAFKPFLLFGVTGSGKTEIYMRLVQAALEADAGVLILVPEIALSSQLESLFRQRFGNLLAVWHSRLPRPERSAHWTRLQAGEKRVLLGVRSAVFMPVPRLGLVIVDEEHDPSYKQEDSLRYHARDVAVMRARIQGVPIVLGSATPSLQSMAHCRSNRYTCLTLPNRVFQRPLPELQVVDMRRQSASNRILSRELRQTLAETMASGKQALLFLNRRGFATFTLCNVCGNVVQCAHCSVSLTYHQQWDRLCCHYCGWSRPLPDSCPTCGHASIFSHGFGTERLEEEVKQFLPGVPLARLDRDTTARPGRMAETLNAVRRGKAKILIGTQMIAKGHDFPDVTLVGIVNGDTSLQIADFRAGETTVQLLMQVAGRAGRGDTPGRVILQTYNPAHYTIDAVLKMDYLSFVEKELESRERLQYPPFTRLVKFLLTSPREENAREAAAQLAGLSREVAEDLRSENRHVAVLGPSSAVHARLKNRFRWHVFVKAWTNRDLQELINRVLSRKKGLAPLNRVHLAVDRDPVMTL